MKQSNKGKKPDYQKQHLLTAFLNGGYQTPEDNELLCLLLKMNTFTPEKTKLTPVMRISFVW
jgi:hypothetical protein